jgi:hypothetical protein
MAKGYLVLWVAPTREQENLAQAREIMRLLVWTMAKGGEVFHPTSDTVAWPLGATVSRGVLANIAGTLAQEDRTWALALLPEPSRRIIQLLPRLRGEIVIDERTAGDDCGRHWDHPLGRELRELGLALCRQSDHENEDQLDPTEKLRGMRNVPGSPEERLEPQRIAIRLPKGRNPGDYADVAYADVPDGSANYNGLGGRHVLLFHSAMNCGCPPYEPPEGEERGQRVRPGSAAEPGVFVFLNAAAVGVKFMPAADEDHPNNLVAHVRAGRIHVERGVAGPEEHHVRDRSDFEE